ncbi:hypothetical protein [Halotia branconii]|uniref:Response regulatory domain-containing protein n=1 Tax=Halotia branconii CENA392 TaxID=1539056 RepID=A0AAJ6NRJ8_9CYAN|nr:hypothetical protein [Halotia branconii]WGV25268.1 hypothetical protein QI031_26550 [Halotia branconii CENA392]
MILSKEIGKTQPPLEAQALVRQLKLLLKLIHEQFAVDTISSEQGGKIPAIALTAYAGEINQQQAIAAGFQLHVAKPIDPESLVAIIVELTQMTKKLSPLNGAASGFAFFVFSTTAIAPIC